MLRSRLHPLTLRDIDTLHALQCYCDHARKHGMRLLHRIGWVTSTNVGGYYTLGKLARRGLCHRKKFGGDKGRWRYRINAAGRIWLRAYFKAEDAREA